MKEAPTNDAIVQGTMGFLDNVNPAPLGALASNFGLVHKKGDALAAVGSCDFTDPNSPAIGGDTMFGEGSVGKIRFAGLGFLMQQEGFVDLEKNANEFFQSPEMSQFLQAKYPDQHQELQSEIGKFFTGSSSNARLVDLTTHHAGVGDLTRDQGELFKEKGVDRDYALPELLIIPQELQVVPRNNEGKPRAQSGFDVGNEDLLAGEFGKHQYSNLGFALLGLALEGANFQKTGEMKSYQDLMKDFMLQPKIGRAKDKGINFDHTKFPQDIETGDDYVDAKWLEGDSLVSAVNFSGANAAGGMFASANDSQKFFNEYFKGFPGTPEAGQDINPFFKPDTISKMQTEWQKYSPANQPDIDRGAKNFLRFQGPGFTVDYPYSADYYDEKKREEFFKNNQPNLYSKTGECFGFGSRMAFDPRNNEVDISMIASENVSSAMAKQSLKGNLVMPGDGQVTRLENGQMAIALEDGKAVMLGDSINAVKSFQNSQRGEDNKYDRSALIPQYIQELRAQNSVEQENILDPKTKEEADSVVKIIKAQQESSNSQMQNSGSKEDDKEEELRSGEVVERKVVGEWTKEVTANSKSSKGPEL